MTSTLVTDIGLLVTNSSEFGDLTDAAFVVDQGKISWVGSKGAAPQCDRQYSVAGRTVIPGFVDSHAHLIFAGDRAAEFEARMSGTHYSAGGISTTVAATRAASDEELQANCSRLVAELQASGITTFEIKSGYGLTVEDELRSLRIARDFTEEVTFLGAHVVPKEYADRRADYVDLVIGMIPEAAKFAKWIDVFCDRGAFTVAEAKQIMSAGIEHGLLPRMHANQLEAGEAVQLAVELDCASADHCTHLSDHDVQALAASNTVATLLPGAEFSTRAVYPDARRLIDAGVSIAIATDCNPGSSYTTSMPFCIAVAVREMGLSVREALEAATLGGARALRRDDVGHLGLGAKADFVELDAPSFIHLAYRPGVNLIYKTHRAEN
ncbi:MAG: hypothetical protein RI933_101 [Actinomycetota bacterium]|jgi:imidazolonepropionase